jgi:uncharacterized membrane protein
MIEELIHSEETVAKSRTEALSDGIFAFAMTLLVISLAVPPIPESTAPVVLPGILAGMWLEFLIFAIAFFVIASFWLSHHRIVRKVKYVDDRLIWINILFLFFIVLIPFSTTISGDYPNVLEAVLLFHANILVASLLLTMSWWYTIRSFGRLSPGEKNPGMQGVDRAIVSPATALIAIAVAFVSTEASFWCYAIIPLLVMVVRRGFRWREEAGREETFPRPEDGQ